MGSNDACHGVFLHFVEAPIHRIDHRPRHRCQLPLAIDDVGLVLHDGNVVGGVVSLIRAIRSITLLKIGTININEDFFAPSIFMGRRAFICAGVFARF